MSENEITTMRDCYQLTFDARYCQFYLLIIKE